MYHFAHITYYAIQTHTTCGPMSMTLLPLSYIGLQMS